MRVFLEQSISERIKNAIDEYGTTDIKCIELSKDEYISFLEEQGTVTAICFRLPEQRIYKDVQIVVREVPHE